jgi:hypothetical protein
MSKRYSIMVQPQWTDKEIELCQVESHPRNVVEGAKRRMVAKGVPRYSRVWIIDRGPENAARS